MSENKNNLVCISGVRGYEEDGVAYLHIEDSARGLGFEKTENKNGVEYNSIRWAIVEGYLQDFGFRQEAVENGKPHDYYIPENIFYRLCMKAKNEVAEAFQAKVADEIIPSIRKTGSYGVTQRSRKDQLYLSIIHSESEEERADALKELAEINKQEVKALTAERDEAIRTKTQYQSNLASQMSGRVGGLTSALNRVRTENDRLKGDRFTVDDIYIIMNISDVSFTLKDPKAVIRDSMNLFSKEMGEPFPKLPIKQKEINGKMVEVSGYVYTLKTVQAYFEFVEANPLGWQARNRKMIMYGWLREKLTAHI